MKRFDWKHRTKFRNKFINPLLDLGIIKMTIPDKSQSSKQKYVITERGKELLRELEME